MYFEVLVDGDATEKPLRDLLDAELTSALKDGTVAALVVLAVLLAGGTGSLLTAGATLGALVFAVLLHQAVLVAGVGVVRWRATDGERPAAEAA